MFNLKNINKISLLGALALVFFFSGLNTQVLARENVDDWYIKDFQSTIEVLADDSAIITEDIVADSGAALKHGIFRILPTETKTPDEVIYMPIELISITDFAGNPYKYQSLDKGNTITWKIGDPKVSISGINNYRIKYKLNNVIRDQADFDELYLNLSGNYWDLEIDKFSAKIILAPGISQADSEIFLYSGASGNKSADDVSANWLEDSVLEVKTEKTLSKGEGITLSLSFPKGYIEHSQIEKKKSGLIAGLKPGSENFKLIALIYALYLLFLPLIVFLIALLTYRRKQKENPYYKRVIVTEYDAPENISPIILGYLDKQKDIGKLITASIVKMAVLKLLVIKEQEKKILFIKNKYLEFIKTDTQENYSKLDESEKYIFELIFKKKELVSTEELSQAFASELLIIRAKIKEQVKGSGYLLNKNSKLQNSYLIAAIILLITGSFISAIILFIFFSLLSNLSEKGQKIYWQIQGFKHYLTVAEKERHSFYEKENIFTKFLPYSIAIANVKEWTKKMKDIYGEEYLNNSLYWYAGASGLDSLSRINSISSQINSISSNISNSIGSSSGSGGGGFSGGGGGGGGGGGW